MSLRDDLLRQHRTALRTLAKDNVWDAEDERLHPRGNPSNPGQFRKKDGPAAPKRDSPSEDKGPIKPSMPKDQRPQDRPVPPQSLPKNDTGLSFRKLVEEQPDHPLVQAAKARGDVYGHFLEPRKGTPYKKGDPRNDPEFEQEHDAKAYLAYRYVGTTREAIKKAKEKGKPPEVIKQMEDALKQRKKDRADGIGGETQELYDRRPNPKTDARDLYHPDRIELHERILDRLEEQAANVPKGGKCLIMGGPSGAGKSTFLKKHGEELGIKFTDESKKTPENYIIINPDDFKELIAAEEGGIDPERYPGLRPNELATILHEESSDLAKRAVDRLMSQGYNVILDVTLKDADKVTRQYISDPENGVDYGEDYTYETVLVDGDMANSLNNAGNRWKTPDEETAERTYEGRFLPMGLVESQEPTRPDEQSSWGTNYRSVNAESFERFIADPRVGTARVFDPFTQTLVQVKGGQRVSSLSVIRAHLRGMLRVQGGRDEMANQVTEKIEQFRQGQITEEALFTFLTEDARYATPNHEFAPGEEGRYHYVDGGTPHTSGSFQEVIRARDRGILSREFLARVNKALYEGGVDEDD